MTQDRNPATCSVCNTQLNSDRELQEHQNQAHSQPKSENAGGDEQNYGADPADRRKSA